jgi:gentisate 1,2-dioxygenase
LRAWIVFPKAKISASPCRYFEYSAAAAVQLPTQPAVAFPSSLHTSPTHSCVTPLDLSTALGSTPFPATSPNLLASFITVIPDSAPLITDPSATSQLFYVIRGSGATAGAGGLSVEWAQGDVFTVPGCSGALSHIATAAASLYWVHDSPLLQYLGVAPTAPTFAPAVYKREELQGKVEEISHQPGAEHRNRMGVLLAHETTEGETKTITRVLWALLNTLPPRTAQPPHRHNSVALDLCVSAAPGQV